MEKKVAIHNLGCKVNAYESEYILSAFSGSGYRTVKNIEEADIVIINTCCVTATAEKKSRQMIHRARKQNPGAFIAAVGCYPEIAAKTLIDDGTADIIVGSGGKMRILELIESGARGYISDASAYCDARKDFAFGGSREHTRGFIKIEDGCDNFCSYCIIPYARGRVKSRMPEDVLREAEALARSGCREVVLSGINLSSYGKDLKNPGALAELINKAAAIDGILRIRLGSLEPKVITDEFLESIGISGKVCPHFHLSLQSGCRKTLKAMNRRYTPEEYLEKCEMIRKYFTEPSLTTDIIAGFPGESPEDFEESYEFVRTVGFFETHVFPYSRREGTKAALMEDQIAKEVKKERVKRLLDLNEETHKGFLEKRPGKTVSVLFEEQEMIDGSLFLSGHTERYEKVLCRGNAALINAVRKPECRGLLRDASGNICLDAGSL